MPLEWIDILSVQGFSAFLLIFLVGYFLVEVVFGKWYASFFFERYENNLFDRSLHYIFWGIVLNILMIIFTIKHLDFFKILIDLFNNAGSLSKALGFEKANIWGESQLIIFSITYFVILVSVLSIAPLIRLVCHILSVFRAILKEFFWEIKNSVSICIQELNNVSLLEEKSLFYKTPRKAKPKNR